MLSFILGKTVRNKADKTLWSSTSIWEKQVIKILNVNMSLGKGVTVEGRSCYFIKHSQKRSWLMNVAFKQVTERSEGTSHGNSFGKSILDQRLIKCKGLELDVCFMCFKYHSKHEILPLICQYVHRFINILNIQNDNLFF